MIGNTTKIIIFVGLALFGLAFAIPTSLTSLVVTGVALISIVVILITSVLK